MRQVQQRLAKQAGSREAGDQTALGQMLTLLLQLGQTMKAQGGSTAPIGFAHLLKMWAQQSNLKPQPSRRGLDRWASLHLDRPAAAAAAPAAAALADQLEGGTEAAPL